MSRFRQPLLFIKKEDKNEAHCGQACMLLFAHMSFMNLTGKRT